MKHKLVLVFLFLLLGAATLVSAQSNPIFGVQVVRQPAALVIGQDIDDGSVEITDSTAFSGDVEFWNTRYNFQVAMHVTDGWLFKEVQVYAGKDLPPTRQGNPVPGKFNCKREPQILKDSIVISCNLSEELEFTWGNDRSVYAAVHADLVKLDDMGEVIAEEGAWAYYEPTATEWEGSQWGWYFSSVFTHPKRGHFIDSPVGGITYLTPTQEGVTDLSGGFDYFPGEVVELAVGSVELGSTVANNKISPLDIFESADTSDPEVINMARLLQSLDADGAPKQGIEITEDVVDCLDFAYWELSLTGVDFTNDSQVESLIQGTINACADVEDVTLVVVSAEDAKENLDKGLDSSMFRKNVSKTPELTSSKSKLNIMTLWFPAFRANNEPTVVEYYDESGALIRTAEEAKPVVVVYTDGVVATGDEDIYAGISRDDGNTFKRMNLSRAADKSSFLLANGEDYYGQAKKPVFQVKGNNILVAWTSKFCKGGKPAYAIDTEDDYPYDDPYYVEDIWGVSGPQRSVDYTDQGFPEVGEVPYSCVWVARGTVVTQGMINSGGFWADKFVGEIVWYKPERLTSGRRDANQAFMGGAPGAGFAIAWQEDPEGLRPGSAAGPGPGWGGATTNHKTDIWYSYITIPDFGKVDMNFVPGGDPEHDDPDLIGRPKALVPMSLPVRLSDNDVVNTDNLLVELGGDGYPVHDGDGNWIPIPNMDADSDGDGSHAYGYAVEGLCESFYDFINYQGDPKSVCITADERLLDGDTGASRPNVFLQTYTKPDGTKSAWAIMAYEETKGMGSGAPEHDGDGSYGLTEYLPEVGKNVIYHSFDFQNPELVSAGHILNLPERDIDNNLLYVRDGTISETGETILGERILDYLGQPQLAYENARRPRFILQGKAAVGASKTTLIVLYKEGQEGQGRPSDIMLRRFVADTTGNPYAFGKLVCDEWVTAENGLDVCVDGAQNMSTVFPTVVTDSLGDPTSEDPWGAVKVVEWEQTVDLLDDLSWVNPHEEARAHRGQIRGDFVVMGFSYTPNWAAARNGNDKYDFYVRRSFDGGVTWTTDPDGSGVTHCDSFTDPLTKDKTEVCNTFGPGEFEQMRNLSQLPNSKSSVIEPRIVAVPGTIKDPATGLWTGIPEDKQDTNVFYVSYGTSTNPGQIHGDSDEEPEFPAPLDLYYSFSQDQGESYVEVEWDVNPDSEGNFPGETLYRWDYMAKGEPEQGEAQLRMTPDGTRFYATWLQEGEEGSDIWFRRIMSPAFPANVAATP